MAFAEFMRPMQSGEEGDVDALLRAAFDGAAEAELVRKLRLSGVMAGEIVLPFEDQIIGYYALSALSAPAGWLCLAPVAIAPEHQGKGHGRRMVGQLTAWAQAAQQWVVVLGQVGFYSRCGFDHARAQRLHSPYPVEHTLLVGPGADVPEATLFYPKEFGDG